MANIPIRDIPGPVVATPGPTNLIPIDNGVTMQKTTIANAVNAALPLASQSSAETGTNNSEYMSSLRTKQAIDAQTPTIVNTAIAALNLGTMSQEDASDYTPTSGLAAVALSNSYTDLSDLPTLGTAAATDASDYATAAQGALADTAIQPGNAALVPSGGTIGQVLVKNSGTNYDTGWVSSAAATAVSYAPQTLTDAQAGQARANIGVSQRGHIFGLTMSNNASDATNDVDIATGSAASDGLTPNLLTLANSMTKRLDASWAVGSGNGGLDTGSIANTTYHVWLIQRSDTGVVDALFSTSATSPTMPTNYDRKRRIGSIVRKSGAIVGFVHRGDVFMLNAAAHDISTTVMGPTPATDVACTVPSGIPVQVLLSGHITSANAGTYHNIDSSLVPFIGASSAHYMAYLAAANDYVSASPTILTENGSVRLSSSGASAWLFHTLGWIDERGRNG